MSDSDAGTGTGGADDDDRRSVASRASRASRRSGKSRKSKAKSSVAGSKTSKKKGFGVAAKLVLRLKERLGKDDPFKGKTFKSTVAPERQDSFTECRKCLEPGIERGCCGSYYCNDCYYKYLNCPSCDKKIDRSDAGQKVPTPGPKARACATLSVMLMVATFFAITPFALWWDAGIPRTVHGFKCSGIFDYDREYLCYKKVDSIDSNVTRINEWRRCQNDISQEGCLCGHACTTSLCLYAESNGTLGIDWETDGFYAADIVMHEFFRGDGVTPNPNMDYWADLGQAWVMSTTCGVVAGTHALRFRGQADRYAETVDFDVRYGGEIEFHLAYGRGQVGCATLENGEVTLAYSTNQGADWVDWITYARNTYRVENYTHLRHVIPANATSAHTRFKWYQKEFWHLFDVFALDEIKIFANVAPDWNRTDFFNWKTEQLHTQATADECCLDCNMCEQPHKIAEPEACELTPGFVELPPHSAMEHEFVVMFSSLAALGALAIDSYRAGQLLFLAGMLQWLAPLYDPERRKHGDGGSKSGYGTESVVTDPTTTRNSKSRRTGEDADTATVADEMLPDPNFGDEAEAGGDGDGAVPMAVEQRKEGKAARKRRLREAAKKTVDPEEIERLRQKRAKNRKGIGKKPKKKKQKSKGKGKGKAAEDEVGRVNRWKVIESQQGPGAGGARDARARRAAAAAELAAAQEAEEAAMMANIGRAEDLGQRTIHGLDDLRVLQEQDWDEASDEAADLAARDKLLEDEGDGGEGGRDNLPDASTEAGDTESEWEFSETSSEEEGGTVQKVTRKFGPKRGKTWTTVFLALGVGLPGVIAVSIAGALSPEVINVIWFRLGLLDYPTLYGFITLGAIVADAAAVLNVAMYVVALSPWTKPKYVVVKPKLGELDDLMLNLRERVLTIEQGVMRKPIRVSLNNVRRVEKIEPREAHVMAGLYLFACQPWMLIALVLPEPLRWFSLSIALFGMLRALYGVGLLFKGYLVLDHMLSAIFTRDQEKTTLFAGSFCGFRCRLGGWLGLWTIGLWLAGGVVLYLFGVATLPHADHLERHFELLSYLTLGGAAFTGILIGSVQGCTHTLPVNPIMNLTSMTGGVKIQFSRERASQLFERYTVCAGDPDKIPGTGYCVPLVNAFTKCIGIKNPNHTNFHLDPTAYQETVVYAFVRHPKKLMMEIDMETILSSMRAEAQLVEAAKEQGFDLPSESDDEDDFDDTSAAAERAKQDARDAKMAAARVKARAILEEKARQSVALALGQKKGKSDKEAKFTVRDSESIRRATQALYTDPGRDWKDEARDPEKYTRWLAATELGTKVKRPLPPPDTTALAYDREKVRVAAQASRLALAKALHESKAHPLGYELYVDGVPGTGPLKPGEKPAKWGRHLNKRRGAVMG